MLEEQMTKKCAIQSEDDCVNSIESLCIPHGYCTVDMEGMPSDDLDNQKRLDFTLP